MLINPLSFRGNAPKAPQGEYLTPIEAPHRKDIIDDGDISLASLYPHALRAHEAVNRQTDPMAGHAIASVLEFPLRATGVTEEGGYDVKKAA